MQEESRPRCARLAGVQEDPDRDGVERLVEVGVGKDDDRRLPAAFDRDALEVARAELHQPTADLAAPGERDLVDARIGRERLADDLALPDDAVRDTGRQRLDPVKELEDRHRRCGGITGRFEDEGAAGRDGSPDLAQWQVDRIVPRRDQPADADGLLQDEVQEVSWRAARHLTVDQPRGTGIEEDPIDRRLQLALADIADRLAHLARDELRQAARFLAQQPGELIQDGRARFAGGRRPVGRVERAARRIDRGGEIVRGRDACRRDEFAGRRIAALERRAVRLDPTAIDVVADLSNGRFGLDHRPLRMASITTSTASFAWLSSIVSGGLILTTCS